MTFRKTNSYPLSVILWVALAVCVFSIAAAAQNRFNGKVRDNADYCLAGTTAAIVIKVKDANNNLIDPGNPSGITACPGGGTITQLGRQITINHNGIGAFCFTGPEQNYYLKIGANPFYKWLAENLRSPEGVYNVEEFGATRDTSINNTYFLKNAVVYIGSRPESGGKLIIPNGVFKMTGSISPLQVGQTDFLPIILPPGITIEGTNGKTNFASSRIQLDEVVGGAGTVLKISGCTDFVTIKNLGIVTPLSPGYRPGTFAIRAEGNEPQLPPAPQSTSSLHFLFSGLTIQGFEEGISVFGGPPNHGWQFDFIKVENSEITDCLYPIRNNTWNTDWLISNTSIKTMNGPGNPGTPRGIGIWIERGGIFTLDNIFGGAPKIPNSVTDRLLRPEAFIKVTGPGSLNIRGSSTEETDHSILYEYLNHNQNFERQNLTITGSLFGDPITIKQSLAFVSMGNRYASNTVQVLGPNLGGNSTATQIYSYGDSFSRGSYFGGTCADVNGNPLPGTLPAPPVECRRDFYLYNDAPSVLNSVVIKTSQLRTGMHDSSGSDQNQFLSPIRINSNPVYDPTATDDKFKYWGYTIRRADQFGEDGFLEFKGNQPNPYTGFRFFGSVYPSADNLFELGNAGKRWSLVRAVTITPGDIILSDRVTGKELYKINEDENSIFFSDVRTGKQLMRLDRDGNLVVTGKVFQDGNTPAMPRKVKKAKARRKQK